MHDIASLARYGLDVAPDDLDAQMNKLKTIEAAIGRQTASKVLNADGSLKPLPKAEPNTATTLFAQGDAELRQIEDIETKLFDQMKKKMEEKGADGTFAAIVTTYFPRMDEDFKNFKFKPGEDEIFYRDDVLKRGIEHLVELLPNQFVFPINIEEFQNALQEVIQGANEYNENDIEHVQYLLRYMRSAYARVYKSLHQFQ